MLTAVTLLFLFFLLRFPQSFEAKYSQSVLYISLLNAKIVSSSFPFVGTLLIVILLWSLATLISYASIVHYLRLPNQYSNKHYSPQPLIFASLLFSCFFAFLHLSAISDPSASLATRQLLSEHLKSIYTLIFSIQSLNTIILALLITPRISAANFFSSPHQKLLLISFVLAFISLTFSGNRGIIMFILLYIICRISSSANLFLLVSKTPKIPLSRLRSIIIVLMITSVSLVIFYLLTISRNSSSFEVAILADSISRWDGFLNTHLLLTQTTCFDILPGNELSVFSSIITPTLLLPDKSPPINILLHKCLNSQLYNIDATLFSSYYGIEYLRYPFLSILSITLFSFVLRFWRLSSSSSNPLIKACSLYLAFSVPDFLFTAIGSSAINILLTIVPAVLIVHIVSKVRLGLS